MQDICQIGKAEARHGMLRHKAPVLAMNLSLIPTNLQAVGCRQSGDPEYPSNGARTRCHRLTSLKSGGSCSSIMGRLTQRLLRPMKKNATGEGACRGLLPH